MIPTSEKEYIELATTNFNEFFKFYKLDHPYKKKEEEIFKEYYEKTFRFNYFVEEGTISYAKKSSIVLLNAIKSGGLGLYYLFWFDKEAYNDEVIEYIEENNIIDKYFQKPHVLNIPQLVILKIKQNRDFIFKLSEKSIDKQVLSYIKKIGLQAKELDECIKKNNEIPGILKCQEFIAYLIENEQVDNIEFLLENNIYVSYENVFLLTMRIESIGRKFATAGKEVLIKNEYLLQNQHFMSKVIRFLNLNNPYNLRNCHLITKMGKSLEKLSQIFSRNDIEIIKREIIENDYDINMVGILNNIDLNKLKIIYDELYRKENKFNDNFSFYYFIKVMDYFTNHLSLVKELNNNEINSEIIDNLALAINYNDDVNYCELKNYINIYKDKILKSNLSYEDKIYQLLINSKRGKSIVPRMDVIDSFKEDILNIPQLTFLQLEFNPESIEYNLLECYIELSKLLNSISSLNEDELKEKYLALHNSFIPNAIYDSNVIRENILRLYAIIYCKNAINLDEIKMNGKYKKVNNSEIYDISGCEFSLFIHDEEFHPIDNNETGDYYDINKEMKNNYLCCEFASDLNYSKLTNNRFFKYSLENPTSLIAFGNRDVYIKHTKKPLVEARYRFINYYDMGMFYDNTHASTEFDFLRFDDKNKMLENRFSIVESLDKALSLADDGRTRKILVFDRKKHEEFLMLKIRIMIEKLDKLNYKQIYKLIALLTKFGYLECYIEQIKEIINKFSEKEQLVLNDALNRYLVYTNDKNVIKIY